MTTSNNPPLKIYCENILGIIFLFLTQYKFKIFFFLFPPFTCHSTATHHVWNLWINASTLSFFIYLFYFPQASIFIETHYAWNLWINGSTLPFFFNYFFLFPQGFHFPRFNLHHTLKNISTPSQPLTSTYFSLLSS